MKKLFVLALLSVAFNAMAEDQYLYWMVADGATVGSQALSGTYYAKVRTADDTNPTYLNFYASPESGADYGQVATIDTNFNMPTFAKMPSLETSFWVELYNSATVFDKSTWVGLAELTWNENNVTSGGMTIANYATVSGFKAAPEPTSGMLLLLGVAGLALRRKNKKA